MAPHSPYISRPEAEAFLDRLAAAVAAPAEHPAVFQVWGIGGVGKSTLTRKVQEIYADTAHLAAVAFGLTEGIDEPIPLMAKLYGQICPQDDWSGDPFWTLYSQYFDTIHQLQTQAATGRGGVGAEQVGQVKTLLQLAVDVGGEFFLSESAKKATQTVVDRGMAAAVAGLSLKDELQGLLQQHKATKRNTVLQRLMLEPLPQLTQAWVAGLAQHGRQQPVLLVLDTYEKVPGAIDTWLWRTVLGNTDLAGQRVRLVVAGRHCVLKTEGWRKLHQDRHAVYERTIERFDQPQTQQYLAEIGLTDGEQVERIFAVTRGLPYYLNWIREQRERGRELDFAQGNQEIVRLLLQGLNATQTQVVQLAACCRWFDGRVIRHLTEQRGLDFATAVDEERNCFGWLTQLSFAEPVGQRWRLDDVARDVFRQSLERADREAIHGSLAAYCLAQSDQEVPPEGTYTDKYENPDWRGWRAEYLYHLLFTKAPTVERVFVSHLLEARYFGKDGLVVEPFQAITAEFDLDAHPLLSHRGRQFLRRLRPAILHGWAVLEEYPLDVAWNQQHLNLSKADTEQAIQECCKHLEDLTGLAKVMALLCKAKRSLKGQALAWLQQAGQQLQENLTREPSGFLADLWLYKMGNTYTDLQTHEEAIAAYDAVLQIKPDDHKALYNKSNALSDLGRYEEAIAAYDAVLQIKPDDHEALYNKGVALGNLGRYEAAITAYYESALAINPDDYEALNSKGFALVQWALQLRNDGREEEALAKLLEGIAAYDAALSIKPDKHEAVYNKGSALFNLGRYEEAIAAYDAALQIKPDDHEALNNKGVALGNLGRYEEAIAAYDAALQIKPDYESVFYNKACAYALKNEIEPALDHLAQAIQLNPEKNREMAKTDSDFDNLRDDPRFQALLR